MQIIKLPRGFECVVDDEDFERLRGFAWQLQWTPKLYVARYEGDECILMHREIIAAPDGTRVDHRDGDGLHNWRSNLRLCTHAQNMRNRKKHKNGRSIFKGVAFSEGRIRARINVDGVRHNLGAFPTELEAALAYDEAALRLHGEFASTNKMLGLLPS